jgi:hypothetical protein
MSDVPVDALDGVYIDPAFYAAAVRAQMSLADAARLANLSYYVHFGTFDQDQNTLEMGGWLGNPFPGSRAPMIAKWKFGEAVMMSPNMARGVPIAGPLLPADEQSRTCGWQGMVMFLPSEPTAPGLAVAASRGAQQHDRVVASAGLFFMTKTPDEAELLGVHIVHGERTTYDAVRALAPLSVTDDSDHSFYYNSF